MLSRQLELRARREGCGVKLLWSGRWPRALVPAAPPPGAGPPPARGFIRRRLPSEAFSTLLDLTSPLNPSSPYPKNLFTCSFNICLFIWLHRVLVAARGIFVALCVIFSWHADSVGACMWAPVP